MAKQTATFEITGMDALMVKLRPEHYAGPMRDFMADAGRILHTEISSRTPVLTHTLVSSLHVETDTAQIPKFVRVRSDIRYGRFQEYGTKRGLKPRRFFRGGLAATRRRLRPLMDALATRIALRWRA